MPIKLLPISLANQIAAGEVIERPASVVKELIENSLDAGADSLVIDIEKGGRRRIRIRDNGAGIVKDELPLALARHATSKISSLADLEAIQSLGFRGEALASISSVARLSLTSKPASQSQAWRAWVEGRDMTAELAPASHPDGTTVDVEDLFFNTPARRKFLRTDKTEFGHIDDLLKRIALSRYDVRLVLNHNQKTVRNYPAVTKQNALERIAKVVGTGFTDCARFIDAEHLGVRLWGWVAPPEGCRHQADAQFFYVNGRMMRDRMLNHAIRQAYDDGLTDERSATYVLYLELAPQDVDVNVHPAKHEVRFHQAREIHDFVLQSIRQVLHQNAAAAPGHQYQAASTNLQQQVAELRPRSANPLPGAVSVGTQPTTSAAQPAVKAPQPESAARLLSVVDQRFALIHQPEQSTQLALLHLQAIERDYLARQWQRQFQTGLSGQPLLTPVKITDEALLQRFKAIDNVRVAQLGILLAQEGRQWLVKQVPSALRHTNITASLTEVVSMLEHHQQPPDTFWDWLASQQLSVSYSKVQAEHWWQVWQQQLQSAADYLLTVALPELPEPLR
ncbi:DNA mismatch repair endonuclease MutL [Pseudidiomarina insulisalsae]|uniref:DNA mismatch repair protein MutL n=1 Tax=Pseudidiomarina insulisalsae TaxID=575789 RepID=A0A432YPH6_9GAMM|nr:DNA mismatch repair endonuclease MutL [Pseudidiomarina insulisalsae]RUO62975.1 DNA mismatch repair protein MutL [Pseudidiomarina insulisalsae]